jgi:CDP-diacylglycerol--glycerol-3-phosphate 3-phosphatidyltransferase
MTPNQVTAARVAAGFLAVAIFALFGRQIWADLGAIALIVASIALDALDGYVARIRNLATPLGAQFDILGDRIIENLFFTFFATGGLITLWVPVFFFARGTITDFLRSAAAKAGRSGFGRNSMLGTRWGRALVASRGSRVAYATLKCVCFCWLGLEWTVGLSTSLVDGWLPDLSRPLPVFDDGLRRLKWHALQGHRIVLISGTLAPLARAFARQIGLAAEIYATELDLVPSGGGEEHGIAVDFWTGHLASAWPNAQTKAHIVRRVAVEHHLDLAHSFAYGNSSADAAMLESVGNPRAVNPSFRLRRIAAGHHWAIEYWKLRAASRRPANFARCSPTDPIVARTGDRR